MMNKCVSIIDIGSNSIKLLVANKNGILLDSIRGMRIGEGISEQKFIIKKDVIKRNIQAIKELLEEAKPFEPDFTIITGTSAVRDAENSEEFSQELKKATGLNLRILSGEEEAAIIAKGVATDPNVKGFNEFCLFDLGGGSLECIHYQNTKLIYAESFPLGVVRLTEKYISHPSKPILMKDLLPIKELIEKEITHFPITGIPLIASGGGLSTAKNILKTGSIIKLSDLEDLLYKLSSITVDERINNFHIPEFRADVMPAALIIIITLAKKAECSTIIHSSFNLRFGLAEEILNSTTS